MLRDLAGRARLVARCLRDPGLRRPPLLWALLRTPRAPFLPTGDRPPAWSPLPALSLAGQTVTDARFVARALAQAGVEEGTRVLEVGTGTGYQAAVLAAMGAQVVTVERIKALHAWACRTFRRLGLHSIDVRLGDGSLGAPDRAPFDVILVACAAEEPPSALLEQLAPGGCLLMPQGPPERMQVWTRWERTADGFCATPLAPVSFVPLVR
jgi:protein-L-isoaspartate(D-aspartate) O-methyltransferase